jgi:drug/metabolite transporter (DMT)-like permease
MHLSPRLVLLLILPPLLWAANAVFARIAINSIGPLWLNALRWGLALLILLPLGWRVLATDAGARGAARALGVCRHPRPDRRRRLQRPAVRGLRTSTPVNVTLIASSLPCGRCSSA